LKIRVVDKLVCIVDKHYPLTYHIFQDKVYDDVTLPKADKNTKVICQYYCGKKELKLSEKKDGKYQLISSNIEKIDYNTDCLECFKIEIVAGVLICPNCNTYYPIIDDIPIIKEPKLRVEEDEKEFTEKWANEIKELLSIKK
jgi:uncharacterized protein YbaR (Trm112 family)